MKTRTMIYLEREQLRALRRRAQQAEISVAELVRRLVQRHLEQGNVAGPPPPELYRRLVGLGRSGLEDVSERHDAYLGAAVGRGDLR